MQMENPRQLGFYALLPAPPTRPHVHVAHDVRLLHQCVLFARRDADIKFNPALPIIPNPQDEVIASCRNRL